MSEKKLKTLPKEKFITIYETFFKVKKFTFINLDLIKILKGEDFSQKPDIFWDELFLIKVKSY